MRLTPEKKSGENITLSGRNIASWQISDPKEEAVEVPFPSVPIHQENFNASMEAYAVTYNKIFPFSDKQVRSSTSSDTPDPDGLSEDGHMIYRTTLFSKFK